MTGEYIYIAELFDKVSERKIAIRDKKVGLTKSLASREMALNNTKSPIGVRMIEAWEVKNMSKIESAIHQLLDNDRTEGEWFKDDEETLVERLSSFFALTSLGDPVMTKSIPDTKTKEAVERTRLTILDKQERIRRLIGHTFTSTRNKENATPVYVKSETEFIANGETYPTLSKALKASAGVSVINAWTDAKNSEGKTPWQVSEGG